METNGDPTQKQDKASVRRANKRKAISGALWHGDAGSLPPEARRAFEKIIAASRVNPSLLSNSSDTFSRLQNRKDIKYREQVLRAQPRMVRNDREINVLLRMLERGEVKEIDRWLDRSAGKGKTYWKEKLGITRGRRPSRETMMEYAKWADMRRSGKSYKEIAARHLPTQRSAEDRIRKGIETYEKAKKGILGKNRK
jgi:hypothetical protein